MRLTGADWQTGLLSWHHACDYTAACCCPCLIVHAMADRLWDQRQDSTQQSALCSIGLSCLLDVPFFFCMDQFATRGCDLFHDNPPNSFGEQIRRAERAPPPPPPTLFTPPSWLNRSLLDYVYVHRTPDGAGEARYGHAAHPPTAWSSDQYGWSLNDASEDWWPCSWCYWHTGAAMQACCRGSVTACGASDTPRLPLAFSCLLAAIYPLAVCPVTFFLRRMVVDGEHLDEHPLWTCGLSLCCAPCALVQTNAEFEHWHPYKAADTGATITTVTSSSNPVVAGSKKNRRSRRGAALG